MWSGEFSQLRLSTLQAWGCSKWNPINSFFFSIILIFHQYFGIQDILLPLNPSELHFVHTGLECGGRALVGSAPITHRHCEQENNWTIEGLQNNVGLQCPNDLPTAPLQHIAPGSSHQSDFVELQTALWLPTGSEDSSSNGNFTWITSGGKGSNATAGTSIEDEINLSV